LGAVRAGTPKLSAAGPDRNSNDAELKVSCAKDGPAKASVVAVSDRHERDSALKTAKKGHDSLPWIAG